MFRGDPYIATIDRRCAVVTPAWSSTAEDHVRSEPVPGTRTRGSDLDVSHPRLGVDAGKSGAGIIGVTRQCERDYAAPTLSYTDGGVGQVRVGDASLSLQSYLIGVWIDLEIGDACAVLAADSDRCIERSPYQSIRIHHLLHTRVVGVEAAVGAGSEGRVVVTRNAGDRYIAARENGGICNASR